MFPFSRGLGRFPARAASLDDANVTPISAAIRCVYVGPRPGKFPRKDDGYDISDYFTVDPCFGTLGDFVQFTHEAHQRGIRVIIDLVVNHTSDQHPWFLDARKSKTSKYRDYYVWSETRPKEWNKGMVFPGVQKSTWSYDERARAWYFHRFYDFQPDLNTSNPAVQEELRKVMGFWLELGVSGFRMDAMPFVIQTKGADKKHVEKYEMLRDVREFLQWRRGDAMILAEANVTPELNMEYFGDDGVHRIVMDPYGFNWYRVGGLGYILDRSPF